MVARVDSLFYCLAQMGVSGKREEKVQEMARRRKLMKEGNAQNTSMVLHCHMYLDTVKDLTIHATIIHKTRVQQLQSKNSRLH